jgi:SAM-dependent methyltransferase
MSVTQDPAAFTTFRDPAGSLELRPDAAYRLIRWPDSEEILDFLATPLAAALVDQQRLVASTPVPDPDSRSRTAPAATTLLLRHPRIPFASYPWEWPPALWLAAAENTLDLCADLVREGWILKDATPLNVLFLGRQPIFVDVLSIARLDASQPIWFAYAQFVRMFLLPMLAYARLGWPLHGAISQRNGYEPEDLYPALPLFARLTQPALSAVTLPHLLSKRKPAAPPNAAAATSAPRKLGKLADPELTRHILLKTLDRLRRQMRHVTPAARASNWTGYTGTATHYVEDDHARKRDFVARALDRARPRNVLDVGCNTGVYARLAAATGASVVAIDTDLQTVDRLAVSLKDTDTDILPLCVDLSNPTPAAGWLNLENPSFLDRATGTTAADRAAGLAGTPHFDTVMMLAVIHHLLLHNQVPLDRIAALAASLTSRHLILEWVPPTDPRFQDLLRGRDALYAHLTEDAFRAAFLPYFTVESELTLANGRILFHFMRH